MQHMLLSLYCTYANPKNTWIYRDPLFCVRILIFYSHSSIYCWCIHGRCLWKNHLIYCQYIIDYLNGLTQIMIGSSYLCIINEQHDASSFSLTVYSKPYIISSAAELFVTFAHRPFSHSEPSSKRLLFNIWWVQIGQSGFFVLLDS